MKLKDCLVKGEAEGSFEPDTASGVRASSLPRDYAEKCIDFDCLHKGGSIHPNLRSQA